MDELYTEEYTTQFLNMQSELEVVFSLMSESQLLQLKDKVESMLNERVYEQKEFPLSCGGLRWVIATIMFSFWCRKGKGVRLVEGTIEVCSLEESPFVKRYERVAPISVVLEEEVPDASSNDRAEEDEGRTDVISLREVGEGL